MELGSARLLHLGVQAAGGRDCTSAGACLGPRRKDGHTWAHRNVVFGMQ